MSGKVIRTTLTLPEDVLAAIDRQVHAGRTHSRNEFVAEALRHELAMRERMAIDAAFAEMADDADYQAEALHIAEEFVSADWEAFQLSEDEGQE